MSYWAIRDALHQLMVRAVAFQAQLTSDSPDWEDLWIIHLQMCRAENYLRIKENE